MTLPIRARLTLWYTAVLALIVVALSLFLGYRLRADLIGGLDQTLVTRAQQVSLALDTGAFDDVGDVALADLPLGGAIALVLDPEGRVVQAAGDAEVESSSALVGAAMIRAAGTASLRGQVRIHIGTEAEPYRFLAVRLPHEQTLVVAAQMESIEAASRRLTVLFALGLPGALVIAAVGGFLLATRALRPIDRMTRAAASIGSDDLSARLDVPAVRDEVGRLGDTLNLMLSRLQGAIEEQRRFTADASHELRTPLSIMQAEIDVAVRSPDTPPEARATLASAREEVQRMTHIVEDLLTLARADDGALDLDGAWVDLSEVVGNVVERMRQQGEAKDVTIETSGQAPPVWGDATRLGQLVSNLVSNAITHTPAGGRVDISVGADTDGACLTVIDTGTGIPREALPHVFERFFRVEASRSRAAGGAGLGLAISAGIAEAHGGSITVESEIAKGSRFTVHLPR